MKLRINFRFVIFFILILFAALVGWYDLVRIVHCIFSLGCDSISGIEVLGLLMFWPSVALNYIVSGISDHIFVAFGSWWYVILGIVQLFYWYALAAIIDAIRIQLKK